MIVQMGVLTFFISVFFNCLMSYVIFLYSVFNFNCFCPFFSILYNLPLRKSLFSSFLTVLFFLPLFCIFCPQILPTFLCFVNSQTLLYKVIDFKKYLSNRVTGRHNGGLSCMADFVYSCVQILNMLSVQTYVVPITGKTLFKNRYLI